MTAGSPHSTPIAVDSQTTRRDRPRAAWIAGTRGAILTLGPAFIALHRRPEPPCPGWLLATGEHGMAAAQAFDALGLCPDEYAPICHPADEPGVRLARLMDRVEAFLRRRRADRVVFTGFGPAAAAAALQCHARRCRGLWLRPLDPARVVDGLRWESGLTRIIDACAPLVEQQPLDAAAQIASLDTGAYGPFGPIEDEIPGLRPDVPLALVAVLRREWGIADETTDRLAEAAAQWARRRPDADWLILSNLNARLEGPVRALDRPPNLRLAPPLPLPLYRAVLARARLVLTDSAFIAAEAWHRRLALATLGDRPAPGEPEPVPSPPRAAVFRLTPDALREDRWLAFADEAFDAPPRQAAEATEVPVPTRPVGPIEPIASVIERWLRRA